MFTINKHQQVVVNNPPSTELVTVDGGCHLTKGERVSMLELQTISGEVFFGIKKKSQRLVLFTQKTFGTFNNFIGAF